MAGSRAALRQFVLFCNCGQGMSVVTGWSERCVARFLEEVLDGDDRTWRACGEIRRLVFHHHLSAIRAWVPDPLVPLWAEQHPGVPVQLQLSTAL